MVDSPPPTHRSKPGVPSGPVTPTNEMSLISCAVHWAEHPLIADLYLRGRLVNSGLAAATASMTWQGRNVHLTSYRWTASQKESSSHSKAGPEEVMVGRQHNGDENGQTSYQYARVTLG